MGSEDELWNESLMQGNANLQGELRERADFIDRHRRAMQGFIGFADATNEVMRNLFAATETNVTAQDLVHLQAFTESWSAAMQAVTDFTELTGETFALLMHDPLASLPEALAEEMDSARGEVTHHIGRMQERFEGVRHVSLAAKTGFTRACDGLFLELAGNDYGR